MQRPIPPITYPATAHLQAFIPVPKPRHKSSISPSTVSSQAPTAKLSSPELLPLFLKSKAFTRLLLFIQNLNLACRNVKVSDICFESKTCKRILAILDTLDQWCDEIPPLETPQRFGNLAFRTWICKLEENTENLLLQDLLSPAQNPALAELSAYFMVAFGNGTRMDYGSGHELAFVAWLCCLDLIDVFSIEDYTAIVTRIFVRYIKLVRKLQKVYQLEPAGSHGVWGLDDFQFLPYYFGSSQLFDHPKLSPKSSISVDIVRHFSHEYMYLQAINIIFQTKSTANFHEHSPILYDISGVMSWSKVNGGMLKMFVAEVLNKFPVVQHFLFGSLLPLEEDSGQ